MHAIKSVMERRVPIGFTVFMKDFQTKQAKSKEFTNRERMPMFWIACPDQLFIASSFFMKRMGKPLFSFVERWPRFNQLHPHFLSSPAHNLLFFFFFEPFNVIATSENFKAL